MMKLIIVLFLYDRLGLIIHILLFCSFHPENTRGTFAEVSYSKFYLSLWMEVSNAFSLCFLG